MGLHGLSAGPAHSPGLPVPLLISQEGLRVMVHDVEALLFTRRISRACGPISFRQR